MCVPAIVTPVNLRDVIDRSGIPTLHTPKVVVNYHTTRANPDRMRAHPITVSAWLIAVPVQLIRVFIDKDTAAGR